ncbi:helix-turn-helix transcriptional regulator [Achromobacter deleyi]|uniref:helix-turn-helix transcriptional regulator n=1 Tax=Achromobacter deleyi TaxID=1353891 RepID=UPI001491E6C6|nr:AraC family transcriptional regulator [Achromobacter deleyi]QVQ28503.1 helix-turn-helix transcriptional regulator [Achromobacter deleyi]UIP18613.1 AraC family transcriptional regulator [Achromobacter deleyi]
MSLAGGTLRFGQAERVHEDLDPGLKLVLVLDGDLRYSVRGAPATHVSGPSLHLSLCQDPMDMVHEFGAGRALRFVSLRTSLDHLRGSFAMEPAELGSLLQAPRGQQPYADANLRVNDALLALGHQMLACSMQGALKRMYLSGKALELAALAFNALQPAREGGAACVLPRGDAERLHHARDLLLADLQEPPSLPELARLAGINVNKLTTGFRKLFGQSVYAFVRERRMEQAHAWLAAGALTVSEAAYACGYTDSHFTKAFQRRYGVLPSSLATRN